MFKFDLIERSLGCKPVPSRVMSSPAVSLKWPDGRLKSALHQELLPRRNAEVPVIGVGPRAIGPFWNVNRVELEQFLAQHKRAKSWLFGCRVSGHKQSYFKMFFGVS